MKNLFINTLFSIVGCFLILFFWGVLKSVFWNYSLVQEAFVALVNSCILVSTMFLIHLLLTWSQKNKGVFQKEVFRVNANKDEIKRRVLHLVDENSKFRILSSEACSFVIVHRSAIPVKSFGEIITLTLTDIKSGCEIAIESKPKLSTVTFDFGQNSKNVRNFKLGLSQLTRLN